MNLLDKVKFNAKEVFSLVAKSTLDKLLSKISFDEAEFKEAEHPRDPDGKFTSGGGAAKKSKVVAKVEKPGLTQAVKGYVGGTKIREAKNAIGGLKNKSSVVHVEVLNERNGTRVVKYTHQFNSKVLAEKRTKHELICGSALKGETWNFNSHIL